METIQLVQLTSLKDGIDGEVFQINRAIHRFSPSEGYQCTLSLQAARGSSGVFDAKVKPASDGFGLGLAQWMRIQNESAMNTLRSRWI